MINEFLFWLDASRDGEISAAPKTTACDSGEMVSWSDCALLRYSQNGKFNEESSVSRAERSLSLFSGVLFNRDELASDYLPEGLLPAGIEKMSEAFKGYRGCFCGLIADFNARCVTLFTDHLANMPVYYYFDDSFFCCSTSVFSIAEELKARGKLKTFLPGAYSLASYAYMLHDFTLFSGVKRLLSGTVATFDLQTGEHGEKRYSRIDNTPHEVREDEAIVEVDRLFTQAVMRQANPNAKYGYDNLCALSAGLDSRMSAFALSRMDGAGLTAFTYSQLMQPDFDIPKRICHDRGWKWIFKSLDGGWDLLRIDDSVSISNGTNYYPWASQLTDFLDCVNLDKFGLIHTGVIGDVVLGTYCDKRNGAARYELGDGAYSQKLIGRLREMAPSLGLPDYDYETGMLNHRGINGAALGYSLSFNRKAVAFSPFMDADFFTFCLHLPMALRGHHALYYKWIAACYPEAARYPHNGVAIPTTPVSVPYKGRSIPIQRVPGLLANTVRAKSEKGSMNPIEWWYKTNALLKEALDEYYIDYRDALFFDRVLQQDVDELYISGSALEKTMCVSLVGSLARFM